MFLRKGLKNTFQFDLNRLKLSILRCFLMKLEFKDVNSSVYYNRFPSKQRLVICPHTIGQIVFNASGQATVFTNPQSNLRI